MLTTIKELELFRLSPLNPIKVSSVRVGNGNLKCGSYQFAFRLINEVTGRSTKYSLFTNPISISSINYFGDHSGPINTFSNKSVSVSFNVSEQESLMYSMFQIAVIENTNGIDGAPSSVSILQPVSLISGVNEFSYSTNERVDLVGIEDIVIDDASLKTFKTMSVKSNKLVGGNVRYKNLNYDNGKPIVTSGEIITREVYMNSETADKSSSESRGYFGGEIYRFYVSFWDDYGDFSLPIVLDMSNVSGNVAEPFMGGFKDMKFPKRDSSNPIIATDSPQTERATTKVLNKGVRISLSNIPSWSKGAVILRAKRKKDILFQSPLIPTTIIQSPDGQYNYPGEGRTAPSPIGTIVPKNMNFGLNKAILRRSDEGDFNTVDWKANYEGFDFCKHIHVAYPPEVMFNNSGVPYFNYVKNGNLSIESVDFCLLRSGNSKILSKDEKITSDAINSNDSQRSSTSTSSAAFATDYASTIYDRSTLDLKIESTDRTLKDDVLSFNPIPQGVSSVPIIGIPKNSPTSIFGAYGDLEISPGGNYNGIKPENQRSVVITTKGTRGDMSYYGMSSQPTGYTTSSVLSVQQPNGIITNIPNENIRSVTGQNSNPGWDPIQNFIEIVNFKKGLSDDRYGSKDSLHQIVSTGATSGYDTVPSSLTFDVFGGDCYISPFTFKVHNSHYAVINSGYWGDNGKGFSNSEFIEPSPERQIKRPFPYRALDYNIGVYLESEVNSLFSEEFLTKGNSDYNQITPNISDFNGYIENGKFYRMDGSIYRASTTGGSSSPKSNINVNENLVTNLGYLFDDFGASLSGSFYARRRPADLFYVANSYTETKQPLLYLYNPEYSLENGTKPFTFIYSDNIVNRTSFSSRMVYSDSTVLQTNIEGFSRFRVANIYDLEESKGPLTKLLEKSGKLFGIQERAFSYIPFETNVLESADGISLAIQSAQVVGLPQYIEDFGSSYIRSVKDTPVGITFLDHRNSKIVLFNEGVSYLNDLGVSKYIESVSSSLRVIKTSDRLAQTYFDYNRNEVVFKIFNEALVMDTSLGNVKTIIRPNQNVNWDYGLYVDSGHLIIGSNSSDFQNRFMVTSINSNQSNKNMLGSPFSSSVKFVSNPNFFMSKVFFLTKFIADKSETVKIEAFSNNGSRASYESTTEPDRQAGFLLNKIRDGIDQSRVRGEYAEITTSLNNNNIASAISKYRGSYRLI